MAWPLAQLSDPWALVVVAIITCLYRGFALVWAIRGAEPHERAEIIRALRPSWRRTPP